MTQKKIPIPGKITVVTGTFINAWITFIPQSILSVNTVNCQQTDSADNCTLLWSYACTVNLLNVCCFKSVPYIPYIHTKNGRFRKKCYWWIPLPGVFAYFLAAQEISSISGSLPDNPGGITKGLFVWVPVWPHVNPCKSFCVLSQRKGNKKYL